MTTDIVGRHHQPSMTGCVVQLLHPCFSHWFPQ